MLVERVKLSENANQVNLNGTVVSISIRLIPFSARGRPSPPDPREPVPSVPPVGEADGTPLRYGGFKAASSTEQRLRIWKCFESDIRSGMEPYQRHRNYSCR
jgi:hypothetical protein